MLNGELTLGEFLGTAFVSYIVTNIDDLIVLLSFFVEITMANSTLKVYHVFIGQYFGFLILLSVSLIGYGLSFAMPFQIFGFLGFFPIILGLKGIIEIILEQWRKRHRKLDNIDQTSLDELKTISNVATDDNNDINQEFVKEPSIDEEKQKLILDTSPRNNFKEKFSKIINYCFNFQTLKVTGITLANSADNIAIYITLFAQATNWQIVLYLVIFLIMLFIWILLAYFFINFPPVLRFAQKFARYIVPVAFIAIGIYIIVLSGCFPWLVRAIQTNNFQAG